MRTTASFRVFPADQAERHLARARWLAQVGRREDALDAYRDLLLDDPTSRSAWAEGFDLLRRTGQITDALAWARDATRQLGAVAFALALEGAALIELGRFRDALRALERAVEEDPDLALVWHEIGYAAYRLREPVRALAALDRAFALEPHTETLLLRARVLVSAGQHDAAEVAFQAAAQSATFDEQRSDIEALHRMAQRYALYESRAPSDLRPAQSVFAQAGVVVLASSLGSSTPDDLVEGFIALVSQSGWEFGQMIAVGEPGSFAGLGRGLRLDPDRPAALDLSKTPLVVTDHLGRETPSLWHDLRREIRGAGRGLLFAIECGLDVCSDADVIGRPVGADGRFDLDRVLEQARHPAALLASRQLTDRVG